MKTWLNRLASGVGVTVSAVLLWLTIPYVASWTGATLFLLLLIQAYSIFLGIE